MSTIDKHLVICPRFNQTKSAKILEKESNVINKSKK